MTYEKYRSAKVPVTRLGKATSGPHKGEVKVRTLAAAGKRPKRSIDYRSPDKLYSGRPRGRGK